MSTKQKSNKWFNFFIVFFSAISVAIIGAIALYNHYISKEQFYGGTTINGVLVGGLNIQQATNVVQANFEQGAKDISVTLTTKSVITCHCGHRKLI